MYTCIMYTFIDLGVYTNNFLAIVMACIHLLIMSPQDKGWSSLFFSAEAGHVATTQSLLRAGANPHLKDKVRPLPSPSITCVV